MPASWKRRVRLSPNLAASSSWRPSSTVSPRSSTVGPSRVLGFARPWRTSRIRTGNLHAYVGRPRARQALVGAGEHEWSALSHRVARTSASASARVWTPVSIAETERWGSDHDRVRAAGRARAGSLASADRRATLALRNPIFPSIERASDDTAEGRCLRRQPTRVRLPTR